MKKILVIGGAGYIGSHVAKEFLNKGYDLRIYDKLSTGQRVNVFSNSEFIEGDILDYSFLVKSMEGIDGVVHLAAKKAVGESMENPDIYSTNNIIGSLNILRAMVEVGIKAMVFSSSAAVYGDPQYLPLDEKHPTGPVSYYGFTKLEIEKFMNWYDSLKGIKYMALRYFNAVGYDADGAIKGREKNPQNLLPIVMEVLEGQRECLNVWGSDYDTPDGTCIRDYVHVSDLATAHVMAMENLFNGGKSQVINLGSGVGTSVKEVITAVENISGKKLLVKYADRRTGDPAALYAKCDMAKKVLGWEAKYTNIEDIMRTYF